MTFTFSSKDTKGGKDPLIPIRNRLEDLDVKTITLYLPGTTTHVVAGKRNTAKSLQALIHATYLVDHGFLDALEYATAPENLNEPESLSPLEADFESNWPNALDFLPGPGKEPNQRPSELFAPDAGRANVFEGYSFVFFDKKQFETLQAPITEGAGKAQIFPVNMGRTTASELAQHVKDAAEDRRKGAIQVRFPGERGYEEWATHVQQQSMILTGQQIIEQNEFLDAILLKDASRLLRRIALQDSPPGTSELPSTNSVSRRTQSQAQSAPTQNESPSHASTQRGSTQMRSMQQPYSGYAPSQAQNNGNGANRYQNEQTSEATDRPARRNRLRGTATRAFTGFLDDVPAKSEPLDVVESFEDSYQTRPDNSLSQGRAAHQDGEMDVDARSGTPVEDGQQYKRSRKRSSPPREEDNEDDLFPAQAAVKRQKLLEATDVQARGQPKSSTTTTKTKEQAPRKIKKKELDVEEALRKKRQAEREAEEDEEPMHKYLENMTVDDMQSLAIVENMDVPERTKPTASQRNGAQSSRWDPRWNGRRNFKKFRRKGQKDGPRRGMQAVIVPLEEVKNTDFGVQDDFWAEKERAREQRKKKAQAHHRVHEKEREREETTPSQSYADAPSHQEEAVPRELVIGGGEPEVIDVVAPRATRQSDRGRQSQAGASARSQGVASRKRPASKSAAASTAKRQRKLNLMAEEDEEGSSEEEVPKFRFRKR